MRLFKVLRSKSKNNIHENDDSPTKVGLTPCLDSRTQIDFTARLPEKIIERIFTFVCPHAEDESYQTCELSASEDGCMLCDTRDLAHCIQVCQRWHRSATKVLYHSIRVDTVHYCEREEMLAEQRKRRSFLNRNAEPDNLPHARLSLLQRTLRGENTVLGPLVQFLKVPFMTREACKDDLARACSVLPNLRYIDLPGGFYSDDQNCMPLKQEIQARCYDIRKMTYLAGAEASFSQLTEGRFWYNLEVLEVTNLDLDLLAIRHVLGCLHKLRALKLAGPVFTDQLFEQSPELPPFPTLSEMLLEETPAITSDGILTYLARQSVRTNLITLSFTATGVHASDLHEILCAATSLAKLSIIETVTTPFSNSLLSTSPEYSTTRDQTAALVSTSLRAFHYEISTPSSSRYASIRSSYYAYLTASLLANGLPNLRALYVLDPDFPESLIDLVPPYASFSEDTNKLNSNNPFAAPNINITNARSNIKGILNQELEVYTKSSEGSEWNFARVEAALPSSNPAYQGRRGSLPTAAGMRPISSYGLAVGGGEGGAAGWNNNHLTPSWGGTFTGGDVRRSVVIGNGMGTFLAVPEEDTVRKHIKGSTSNETAAASEWPTIAKQEPKGTSRYDIWR